MLPTTYSFIFLPFIHIHSFHSRQIPATTQKPPPPPPRATVRLRDRLPQRAGGSRLRRRKSTGSDRLAAGVRRPGTLRFFVIPTPELAPNAAVLELEGTGRACKVVRGKLDDSRKFSGKWDTHF